MESWFTALLPIAALLIIVIFAKQIASHAFRCKHCSKEFHIKWSRVLITKHVGAEYLLMCPHCKIKGWCLEQPKE